MHRYYQAAARSKRSLALDLTKPGAQPILKRLLEWAELVHHNMRFKGAAKLGLSEEGIRRHNPDVAFNYASAYGQRGARGNRSEEHTSELQSLMRISYAVFCLKKKKNYTTNSQRT